MIALAVWFPIASFAMVALVPHRALRNVSRIVLSAIALGFTVFSIPRLDGLSAVFAVMVSFLCALVVVFATSLFPGTMRTYGPLWSRRRAFFVLIGGFWTSMLLAVTAGDFIGLWAGISATTLTTTFLVAYVGGREALEAAWKYLILCSFGIAIALIGIMLLGRAAMAAGALPADALAWNTLATTASTMSPSLVRVSLLLMLIGFATKAGLVPMHAWLPDAHSKAPAPVSALLSGLLVSCALYAIMRVQAVAAHTTAASLFDTVLLAGGGLSVIVASLLMLAQRDVKRLLSYSTIEHAGLVAIALGIATPLAAFAAVYHVLNHAFGKSLAFLAVGVIQSEEGTTSIGHLKGLWHRPSGRALLGALIGLAGLPPFGLFLSELLIVIAAVIAHNWIALTVTLVGLSVAFAALLRLAIDTSAGTNPEMRTKGVIRSFKVGAMGAVVCVAVVGLLLALVPFSAFGRALYDIVAQLNAGT
jgi:hydrogenase-4 component F